MFKYVVFYLHTRFKNVNKKITPSFDVVVKYVQRTCTKSVKYAFILRLRLRNTTTKYLWEFCYVHILFKMLYQKRCLYISFTFLMWIIYAVYEEKLIMETRFVSIIATYSTKYTLYTLRTLKVSLRGKHFTPRCK